MPRAQTSRAATRITLSPGAWALLLAGFVVLAAAIGVMLATLLKQYDRLVAQDRKIGSLLANSEPVLDRARPVLDNAQEQAPKLRAATRETRRLLRSATPLVNELAGTDLPDTARRLGALAGGLTQEDRLLALVDGSNDLLARLREDRFFSRALRSIEVVPDLARIQRATLRVQLRTLAIQQRSLATLERSLAVQEESLRHIRSLDRKTGGELPPARAP
jgi:hypothetical protein